MLETQPAHAVALYVLCEVKILIGSLDQFSQVSETAARPHTATQMVLSLECSKELNIRCAPLGCGGLADLSKCLLKCAGRSLLLLHK